MLNSIGSRLDSFDFSKPQSRVFAERPYFFKMEVLDAGDVALIDKLKSAVIFLSEGEIRVNNILLREPGQSIQSENTALKIESDKKSIFFIAGSEESKSEQKILKLFAFGELKQVDKPWGSEVWITGEHPLYCLKRILIKARNRTSLQYHNFKRETNVLLSGAACLHYSESPADRIENLNTLNIQKIEINPVSVVDVVPKTIHRLEAVTDILLFEASTPELDDVVRISDDTNRADGRIISEHKNNAQ
ncbi:MAG: hypothetical protein ACXVAX_08075 [Pseudobdellovibrio sp.]